MTGQIGHVSFTLQERLVSPVPSHGSTKTVRRTAHPMFAWVREEQQPGPTLMLAFAAAAGAKHSRRSLSRRLTDSDNTATVDLTHGYTLGLGRRVGAAAPGPRTNCAYDRPAKGPLLSSTRTDTPCMNHTVSTQVCFAPERAIHGSQKPPTKTDLGACPRPRHGSGLSCVSTQRRNV